MLASKALVKCADDNACVDSLYTDVSKAFDSISHIGLKCTYKLHAYDINTNVCDWIEQFLSNKLQRVILNDCMSEWLQCTIDVP